MWFSFCYWLFISYLALFSSISVSGWMVSYPPFENQRRQNGKKLQDDKPYNSNTANKSQLRRHIPLHPSHRPLRLKHRSPLLRSDQQLPPSLPSRLGLIQSRVRAHQIRPAALPHPPHRLRHHRQHPASVFGELHLHSCYPNPYDGARGNRRGGVESG